MFFEEGVSRCISCCKVNYDASYLILNKSSYTQAEWTGDIVSVVWHNSKCSNEWAQ